MQCVGFSINDLLRISRTLPRIALEVLLKVVIPPWRESQNKEPRTEKTCRPSSLAQAQPALMPTASGLRVGAAMRFKIRVSMWLRKLVLVAPAALALAGLPRAALSDGYQISLVAPGMNQTELQSVMGPPSYIQVKGLRQAWQYCPPRSLIRFIDDMLGRETEPPLFVTVWFNSGRVEHMRAYPSRVMGRCEDFLAAFSWEDTIDGGGFEYGGRIK
jgi:hypothetical protein